MQFRNSTVNIQGQVTVIPVDNPSTLIGPGFTIPTAAYSSAILNVSQWQSLDYEFVVDSSISGAAEMLIRWYADAAGSFIISDDCITAASGGGFGGICYGQVRCKSAYAQLSFNNVGTNKCKVSIIASYRQLPFDIYENPTPDSGSLGISSPDAASWGILTAVAIAGSGSSTLITVPSRKGRGIAVMAGGATAGQARLSITAEIPGQQIPIVQAVLGAGALNTGPIPFVAPSQQLTLQMFCPTATGGNYNAYLTFLDG